MRQQMALDWITREHDVPGRLRREIDDVDAELTRSRLNGRELRFSREKRDILMLARSQLHNSSLA